jgi:hypothetical protein
MNYRIGMMALVAALGTYSANLRAQDISKYTTFTFGGRTVQFHGFASQGFAYSNENNYLTMKTSKGSFAFTDGGVNVSTQLTDKLRVGGQVYVRDIGNLGKWHPQLDWAQADYKFKDWFGIRGGVVKTVFGLHGGLRYGADLRWNTPLKGLLVGMSGMKEDITGSGNGCRPCTSAPSWPPCWTQTALPVILSIASSRPASI